MNKSVCPECRKTIPRNSPDGICPDCLLAQGLGAAAGGGAFAVTTPEGGRITPPAAADVAGFFPQLNALELIGHGGMGAVYKARQTKLDRLVAVKIIRPETTADPAFAERFMREARAMARLNHPGIVAIHDFGEIDATDGAAGTDHRFAGQLYYFIMEYVDGANLRQLMQTGQLSPELAVTIVPQVCEALQFAHDDGVVHRDIKPENILLDSKGRVKIADFGLAKIAGGAGEEWTLTGTHQVMGTPRYMAPEQMAGSRTIDHRADIYSLGVVFYEMLTGTVPAGHFAPPSQKSNIDARLDEVVLRAMASEPERRFQAARDLRASVEQISSPSLKPMKPSAAVQSWHETGFSTILDREVLGAWRLVSGESDQSEAKPTAVPIMLLMLLCLVGGIGTLLPWFDVGFKRNQIQSEPVATARTAVIHNSYVFCQDQAAPAAPAESAVTSRGVNRIPWEPGAVYQSSGVALQTGFLTAIIFGLLGLLRFLVPRVYQTSITVNGTLAILALSGVIAILLARIEIRQVQFRFPAEMASEVNENPAYASRDEDADHHNSGSAYVACFYQQEPPIPAELSHPDYHRQIATQPGYFVSLGIASLVLILSSSVVRQQLFREHSRHNSEPLRADVALVSIEDARDERLPDLCVVCGKQTSDRVRKKLQYQSKNAQALMMLGFILGGIPGVIIAVMTQKETPISCPVCHEHRNHWNRLVLVASIGWIIPILTGGTGLLLGFLATNSSLQPSDLAVTGLVVGIVFGLLVYVASIIYLACTQVKCEQTSDDQITFSRVASPFARSVRRLRKA
jgi:tRNA A-37 threonylcarbamoyl transferase component Bud32